MLTRAEMVRAAGLEPATSAPQTRSSTIELYPELAGLIGKVLRIDRSLLGGISTLQDLQFHEWRRYGELNPGPPLDRRVLFH
jgi:hypothetical protein